jgi:hypothetical protein
MFFSDHAINGLSVTPLWFGSFSSLLPNLLPSSYLRKIFSSLFFVSRGINSLAFPFPFPFPFHRNHTGISRTSQWPLRQAPTSRLYSFMLGKSLNLFADEYELIIRRQEPDSATNARAVPIYATTVSCEEHTPKVWN